MLIDKKKTEEAIWLFTANTENRPSLNEPHTHKNYYWASDSFCLATTRRENVSDESLAVAKDLNNYDGIASIIAEGVTNVGKRIDVSEVRRLLSSIPKEREQVKDRLCLKCDGEGFLTCEHCDSEYDCPECEDGWIYKPGAFIDVFEKFKTCHVGDAFLNPGYVKKLVDVADLLGETEIEHVRDMDAGKSEFLPNSP